MPRNLYNRVELVVPVEDERVRAEVIDVLDRSLADETNRWQLQSDGQWLRHEPPAEGARSVQRELAERAQARVATDIG
jgi:polyphosphate kinase